MKTLIETLTDEPHSWSPDFTWYDTVDRMGPAGNNLSIEVEVGVDWDGTPAPECKYYVKITKNIDIGEGLMIKADSFIMLDEVEQDDFLYTGQCRDWIVSCRDADDHEKDSEHYYATTR